MWTAHVYMYVDSTCVSMGIYLAVSGAELRVKYYIPSRFINALICPHTYTTAQAGGDQRTMPSSRDCTQTLRVGSGCLYLLGPLASPIAVLI